MALHAKYDLNSFEESMEAWRKINMHWLFNDELALEDKTASCICYIKRWFGMTSIVDYKKLSDSTCPIRKFSSIATVHTIIPGGLLFPGGNRVKNYLSGGY